ncbi:hypothetical protein BUALT_Bualt05G0116600 [Buddleja alternifolia]|uniref:Uncharacterized protein n=1 Tax=Buddleja alternifolia TaxID=168488 RepID=A0AAV6XQ79_9LAMI|nr:hypothetical protein BUALT_Bualt05G0116600 [Buddleja alternifolia]
MASSSFSFCSLRNPHLFRLKVQLPPAQIRSQNFSDEGNSSNGVDANLSVLRYRMEKLRMKERLKACDKLGNIGWNYKHGYDDVRKKNAMFLLSIELASIVGSTIGLVFVGGSFCIFLVALIFNHG